MQNPTENSEQDIVANKQEHDDDIIRAQKQNDEIEVNPEVNQAKTITIQSSRIENLQDVNGQSSNIDISSINEQGNNENNENYQSPFNGVVENEQFTHDNKEIADAKQDVICMEL